MGVLITTELAISELHPRDKGECFGIKKSAVDNAPFAHFGGFQADHHVLVAMIITLPYERF
jgi:hypothetical protein